VQRDVIVSPSDISFRFGSDRRLHRPGEFSLVFASRLALRNGKNSPFVLHCRFSSLGQAPRLGLVIPKRYARSAVLRNALKRQVREVFRLSLGRLPACDLVLRLDRALRGGGGKAALLEQKKIWRRMIEALFAAIADLPHPANR
jgi:ribonuclease P protein component